MFSKHLGVKDTFKAELVAILESLCIFSRSFLHELIVESDYSGSNAISWVNAIEDSPWKFHFYFDEIKFLISSIKVVFHPVC